MLNRVARLLQAELDVIATVRDGQALIDAATRLAPDLLIVDVPMPILCGIEAAFRLMRSGSAARFVFWTVHEDTEPGTKENSSCSE